MKGKICKVLKEIYSNLARKINKNQAENRTSKGLWIN